MSFELEKWNELTRNIIANSTDQAQLTALVTQASDSVSELFVSYTETAKQNEELVEENEKLKKYNLDLFMRVSDDTMNRARGNESEKPSENRAETITIKKLFEEGDK